MISSSPAPPAVTPPEPEWQQPHWAYIVIGVVRNLRGWIVPIVVLFVSQGASGNLANYFMYVAGAGIVCLSALGSLIDWLNYRYRLTDRAIELRHGIISKQERVVPYERVQSVDISVQPLDRLFGVARLKVQTAAGGSAAEVELRSIGANRAEQLRRDILAARTRLRAGEPVPAAPIEITDPESAAAHDEGDLVRRMSTRDLLLAGATSGQVGAFAAIVAAASQLGQELLPEDVWKRIPVSDLVDLASSVRVIVVAVLVFGLISWLISIASTMLTYGGFTVRRAGDQLHIQYGWLDNKRISVPVRRIQSLRTVESPLRQPFGLAELRYDSAGTGAEQGASGVLFPLIRASDVGHFIATAVPEVTSQPIPQLNGRLPARSLPRFLITNCAFWIVFVGVVTAIAWYFSLGPRGWPLAGLILVIPLGWLGYRQWADTGWVVANGDVIFRWRTTARITMLTRARRLQYRTIAANPLQRRANLANFRTAVATGSASGGVVLEHLDRDDAERLMAALAPSVQVVDALAAKEREQRQVVPDLQRPRDDQRPAEGGGAQQ